MISEAARVSVNTHYQVSQKNTDKLWSNFERDLIGRGSASKVNEPMTRNDLIRNDNLVVPNYSHKPNFSARYADLQSSQGKQVSPS